MASDICESVALHSVNRYLVNVILQHVTDVPDTFKLVCSLEGKQSNVYESHTTIIHVYQHGTALLWILLL
jgi:hypothetical protein